MAKASMETSMETSMEAAMEVWPEKERPGADEEWIRAVIWIAVIRVAVKRVDAPVGLLGIAAWLPVAVARGRHLDDVALTRHALGIGDVVLPLRSSGDGARVGRA